MIDHHRVDDAHRKRTAEGVRDSGEDGAVAGDILESCEFIHRKLGKEKVQDNHDFDDFRRQHTVFFEEECHHCVWRVEGLRLKVG